MQRFAKIRQRVWPLWQVALALMLALCMAAFSNPVAADSVASSSDTEADCTLTVFEGIVFVIAAGETEWEFANDGMTLTDGTWVHTAVGSSAMLIFFEGSTITLDANTTLEVRQLSCDEEEASTIIRLKQWLGRSFSRVVKMFELGSSYEVETPSGVAVVRGTQFYTEVDYAGATVVHTTEGLVSVIAQGAEVQVAAGHQTTVDLDTTPTEPEPMKNVNGKRLDNLKINNGNGNGNSDKDNGNPNANGQSNGNGNSDKDDGNPNANGQSNGNGNTEESIANQVSNEDKGNSGNENSMGNCKK